MNVELLEAEYRAQFTPERRSELLEQTLEAYDRARDHYSAEDGADRQTFSFTLYKYIRHRLVKLGLAKAFGMDLRQEHPMVRLGVGPFILAAYSCGPSGEQLISESFPLNEGGAPQMADLNAFEMELGDVVGIPRALVLAHLGNVENGLEALYLAFPESRAGNRIASWSYTDTLYHRGEGGVSSLPPDLPPPTLIERAPLTLKFPAERPGITAA